MTHRGTSFGFTSSTTEPSSGRLSISLCSCSTWVTVAAILADIILIPWQASESPRGQVVRDAKRLVITEIFDFRTTPGHSPCTSVKSSKSGHTGTKSTSSVRTAGWRSTTETPLTASPAVTSSIRSTTHESDGRGRPGTTDGDAHAVGDARTTVRVESSLRRPGQTGRETTGRTTSRRGRRSRVPTRESSRFCCHGRATIRPVGQTPVGRSC